MRNIRGIYQISSNYLSKARISQSMIKLLMNFSFKIVYTSFLEPDLSYTSSLSIFFNTFASEPLLSKIYAPFCLKNAPI